MYRIILLILCSVITHVSVFGQIALQAGDFRTIASGDFDNPAIWETWNGTAWAAAVQKPEVGNNIFIDFQNEVRITGNESVNSVFLNAEGSTGRKLNLQTHDLNVFGSLNLMARSGTDYSLISSSTGITVADWIYPLLGRIVFRGTSRTVVTSASWSAQNTRSNFTVVFDPDPDQTLTVNAPFKAGRFIIASGSVIQGNSPTCSIFSFNSDPVFLPGLPFGEFIIESGASLISNCSGPTNPIIRRSGSLPASLFQIQDGANLTLGGNIPYLESSSLNLEGTVQYISNTGTQQMMQSSMAGTENPTNYHNLSFANGATKVLRPALSVSGNLSRVSGSIPQEPTGGTSLTFTGNANQQVNGWPLDLTNITVNKPSGTIRLDNDLRVKNNLTMTSGRIDFGDNNLFINTAGTGNYSFTNGSWLNLANLHYNQIPSTLSVGNATFPFEDRYQGGIRAVQLLGNSPGGDMHIRYTEIPGSNWDPDFNDNDGTPIMYELNSYFQIFTTSSSSSALTMRISADNLIVDDVDDLRITASGQAAEGTHLPGEAPLWARRNLVFGDLDQNIFTIGSYRVLSILPLKWVDINGSQEGSTVTISWQVAQENHNRLFEVEESKDNVLNFEKVGQIPSLGDFDSLRTYQFSFTTKYSSLTRYYRIKQVDENGDYSYSSVIKLSGHRIKHERPMVYPNPLTKQSTLQIQLPSHFDQSLTKIMLIDPLGEVILESSSTSFQNLLSQKTLKTGLYLIQIQHGYEIVVEKLWVR